MKLVLFGGKGGVGKTTCSSSSGLYFAEKKQKTLVICTDPAHSLGDSYGQALENEINKIEGVENLSALEINSNIRLEEFKKKHGDAIKKLLDTATQLDEEDIESMFQLPIPGMDELMGFKAIVDLIEESNFDKYIVDTAPTGHALKLIFSPQLINDYVKVMAKMRWKYKYMVKTFSGKNTTDTSDDFLMDLKRTITRIEKLLKDEDLCEFVPVAIPEAMSVLETQRLISELIKYGIHIQRIVINNVITSEGCQFCRDRKNQQQFYINQIRDKFAHLKIVLIPLQNSEIRGIEKLNKIKNLIFG
ncbi:MAG TPA: ATPase [Lentisphaeria bacterium]|nr:MAG: ATPase [Lentisphaerae bacterium GWF2_38_69]HBM16045.1 ATPase [Lentisphaeria bacterium]